MSGFKLQLFTSVVVTCVAGVASAAPCQAFSGLQHCAVDGATLSVAQDMLTVTDGDGEGGVSIATPGAKSWSGSSRIKLASGVGDVLTSSSISRGAVTSRAQALRTTTATRLSATFASPTYTTRIYRNGNVVATAPSNSSGVVGGLVPGGAIVSAWQDLQWPTFDVMAGGATWTYRTTQGADRTINLPDGRSFIGDEIRFSENVAANPALTFDGLVFEGDIATTQFADETVDYSSGM